MLGKIIFGVATICFLTSLGVDTVSVSENHSLNGIETFFYTLRYGTAGVFGANSVSNFVIHFVALAAAAANFVFVFWALLVFSPTRITSLKWFWWFSLLFLLAAAYTGIQALLDSRVGLQYGYGLWMAALMLMLLAPVVSRLERKRRERKTQAIQAVKEVPVMAANAVEKETETEVVV